MGPLVLRGKVWKYGDNLDSERMAPGYIWVQGSVDENDLAKYAWIDIDPDFHKKVKPGDVVVAGINCGYGSSRGGNHVRALKATKLGGIVAESHSRLFLRSCINDGVPAWSCKGITELVDEGDEIEVNLDGGQVMNLTKGRSIQAQPLSKINLDIIKAGGLLPYIKRRLKQERQQMADGSTSTTGSN